MVGPMTTTDTPIPTPAPVADPVTPATESDASARLRAQDCGREIEKVVAAFRCRIVPVIQVEQVGNGSMASKVLAQAAFMVVPE